MIEGLNKEKVRSLLRGKLPGQAAHSRMEPGVRLWTDHEIACREAAVMILLYPENGSLRIVFIKRNEYEGPHSGQVSFPGGMKERSDKDHAATAIRETAEETGIAAADIEILGELSSFFIAVSNFCVRPFVGWLDYSPDFNPDSTEVQYLICPALSDLFDPECKKLGEFNRKGNTITTPYFDVEGEMIWGATAMMLNEFMELFDSPLDHH